MMNEKTVTVSVTILTTLVFLFLLITLSVSHTTVDPDTVSSLLKYGRGSVTWEHPVIWNVHMIYGTYLLIAGLVTSSLVVPVAFLSAISTVIFLLAGFRILRNHLDATHAFWGFLLLMVIPGYHLLNLRLEDNLPLLAGIGIMAAAIDSSLQRGVTFPRLLLAAAGFSWALLFHTIAIIYAFLPLLLIFRIRRDKPGITALRIVFVYVLIAVMVCGVLSVIPEGFRLFKDAYSGSYGIESNISAFSNDTEAVLQRVQKDWILPFREVNNIPLEFSKINSPLIRFVFIGAVVGTNILFYGFLLLGIVRALRSWKSYPVPLAMLLVSGAVPLALAAFIIERVDMPVFFAVVTASIGMWRHTPASQKKNIINWAYYLLVAVLVFWNGALYAQCARWLYRPPEYRRFVRMLKDNNISYKQSRSMLFTEEAGLFEHIDYFIFIRRFPRMIHYGIEPDGDVYRIDGGWVNDKYYLSNAEIDTVFGGGGPVYATSAAVERFRRTHTAADGFIELRE